ncbi:MAG: hypothetical protein F6K30_03015 [Cyanothece sp. SIO2G6]|nr:hypothetical protein [Cyanothece sp. SIO2G6]
MNLMDANVDVNLSEEQLKELVGSEQWATLGDDDGDTPTILVSDDGGNVFLKFTDRRDAEFLMNQIAEMLSSGDDELAVRVSGTVTSFKETW